MSKLATRTLFLPLIVCLNFETATDYRIIMDRHNGEQQIKCPAWAEQGVNVEQYEEQEEDPLLPTIWLVKRWPQTQTRDTA